MVSSDSGSLVGRLGGEDEGKSDSIRKVVTASVIGTAIEWYDYFLYATAAALVFSELFFPSADSITGTMAAFATYAVGFAVRPLGGIFFGHFGDRIGRKAVLVATLLLMGTSTFLDRLPPDPRHDRRLGAGAAGGAPALAGLRGRRGVHRGRC